MPSKNPSKKQLLVKNLLRTFLRVACGCMSPLVCALKKGGNSAFENSPRSKAETSPLRPRNYLSDTPLLRAMGFLVSQHGQLGAIPPLPFLRVSPVESIQSGGAIPPPKRGISAILARYPIKTRQMGAIDTISQRYCAIGGGFSHWAAKDISSSSGIP